MDDSVVVFDKLKSPEYSVEEWFQVSSVFMLKMKLKKVMYSLMAHLDTAYSLIWGVH